MLIHSVTPLDMLMEMPPMPQRSFQRVGEQYLEGYDTPQGFCLSRIHSTDLSLYLKDEYSPGRHLKRGNSLLG